MTSQLGNIIQLRCKQFGRILYCLGVVRMLLVIALMLMLIAVTYKLQSTVEYSYLVASGYLVLSLIIHLKRTDKNFLKINIPSFRMVCWLEYLLLSLFLIISLVLHGRWLVLLFVVAGTLLISIIDYSVVIGRTTINTRIQRLISFDLYEWKAGIRRNFVLLIIIYVSGVCLSFYLAVIPVVMVVLGLIIVDFFGANESWQMLLSFEKSPGRLMLYKIRHHTLHYAVICLPLIALFILFHPDFWYVPVIEFVIMLTIHIYTITVKYAYYRPERGGRVNFVLQIVGIVLGLIPITAPFLLLFSIFFFQKACTNLKPLLYDYD